MNITIIIGFEHNQTIIKRTELYQVYSLTLSYING